MRETLIELTPWPLSKGLDLVFDVDDAQYRVTTDAGAINIALTNLVTNAANFSPEHGMITVGLCKTARGWGPSVDDQGPGIDESQSERLFERFYSRGNAFDSPPAVHTMLSIAACPMSAPWSARMALNPFHLVKARGNSGRRFSALYDLTDQTPNTQSVESGFYRRTLTK